MQEDMIFSILILVLIFGVFAYTTVRDAIKKNRRFLEHAKKFWGKVPDREYTYEEFRSISDYARRRKGEDFFIDDITWNDLDMDQIFMLANNTVSSCGEEYLYEMLRKPLFDQEKLDERNRLIEFFRTNEDTRIKVQKMLAKIGKTYGISLGEYIYRLQDVPRKSNRKYILLAAAMLFSLVSLFFMPVVGIIGILVLMVYNMILHTRETGKMEAYLRCFQCILNMCAAAAALEKAAIPELEPYTRKLSGARKGLANFGRASFLVTSKGTVSTDIGNGMLEYANMLFHLDKIKFNSMLRQLDGHQEDVETLMENLGILDSAIGIASFREYLPYYCRGEFISNDASKILQGNASEKGKSKEGYSECSGIAMEVHNLYHPLISEPVANSITVQGGTLITGSNASGKSTFLKNIAINSILAQTIDTAVATWYKASFMKIMTSMALNDNLDSGESYYIVEIKSLKRILDESKKGVPLLCIIDEVLRGTNTIERIAASSQILRQLNQPHVLPFAATHDLELSYILERAYTNYHFEEEISDEDIRFNYLLKTGRTNTRNAIRLLEQMGYDREIVERARKEAAGFEETGVWEVC